MSKAMAKTMESTMTVAAPQNRDKEAPFSSCPVDNALKLISGKWKPRILYRLSLGTQRFGELQRSIPEVTQRMLTLQLRELERDGLIKRKVYAEVPPKVEYSLTQAAKNMGPILLSFGNWFDDHASELLKN